MNQNLWDEGIRAMASGLFDLEKKIVGHRFALKEAEEARIAFIKQIPTGEIASEVMKEVVFMWRDFKDKITVQSSGQSGA